MKKYVSVAVLAMLLPAVSFAAPSHITKQSDGGYNVTYDYADRERSDWYVSVRAELAMLNWTNKMTARFVTVDEVLNASAKDSYSFEPVFGGNLAVGRAIDNNWRAEVEAGYIGHYSDSGDGIKFSMGLPYATVNGYYDFDFGMYVGLGLGGALQMTKIEGAGLVGDKTDNTTFAPMGALMIGYATRLNQDLIFDIRYRIAGIFGGGEHKTSWQESGAPQESYVANKIDSILDNSISFGLRYNF